MADDAPAAPRLAISTQWARRFASASEFAEQVLALGIGRIELNYEPTPAQIKDILTVPGIAISSVHLPAPHAVYNGRAAFRLPLNAPDETERQAALGFARVGLELASEVGAKTVVVHAGAVPGPWPVEGRLRRLYRRGYADSEDYRATYNQLMALRAMYAPPALERTRRSLSQLAEWASRFGIVLGLESRYYYSEIPNLNEAAQLIDEFGDAVGYWHDTGHVENLARLAARRRSHPRHRWPGRPSRAGSR